MTVSTHVMPKSFAVVTVGFRKSIFHVAVVIFAGPVYRPVIPVPFQKNPVNPGRFRPVSNPVVLPSAALSVAVAVMSANTVRSGFGCEWVAVP